jgi:hypothetical protein
MIQRITARSAAYSTAPAPGRRPAAAASRREIGLIQAQDTRPGAGADRITNTPLSTSGAAERRARGGRRPCPTTGPRRARRPGLRQPAGGAPERPGLVAAKTWPSRVGQRHLGAVGHEAVGGFQLQAATGSARRPSRRRSGLRFRPARRPARPARRRRRRPECAGHDHVRRAAALEPAAGARGVRRRGGGGARHASAASKRIRLA